MSKPDQSQTTDLPLTEAELLRVVAATVCSACRQRLSYALRAHKQQARERRAFLLGAITAIDETVAECKNAEA